MTTSTNIRNKKETENFCIYIGIYKFGIVKVFN